MEPYRLIDTDVLVIGGGMGGCQAAMRAKDLARKVILAEKAYVSRSGATVFCHLSFSPVPPGQLKDWVEELAKHATYLCDQEWAEIMLRKDRHEGKVALLSLGPLSTAEFLKETMSTGVDEAILLADEALEGGDSFSTGHALAEALVATLGSPTWGEGVSPRLAADRDKSLI